MNQIRYGAIDIGSNAIRLLINYVEKGSGSRPFFKKAAFIRVPIRLGEDVFSQGKIGEQKAEQLTHAMIGFAHLMRTFNVRAYRACATSAMREAANGDEVVAQILEQSGIQIEIISGQEEAETIFAAGDLSELMHKGCNYVYVDVGGGSTELTIYSDCKRVDSRSFPLGTVRMLNDAVDEKQSKKFRKWLEQVVAPYKPVAIIGSGGNINKVHKMLGKRDRKEVITSLELKLLKEELKRYSYDERVEMLGLNTYRADVIMPAVNIFLMVTDYCRISKIMVPKIGLADGIIHQLYLRDLKK